MDGIRAVAVALVLADHGGIPGLSGGFLGVDVFFVLSGFLITSLLLDEHRRSARIRLADFWIRRARRLLPALIVMVLAVVAARELFSPESTVSLRDDAVASFFWISNWAFVAQQTDYFSQGAPPSPLQHTWSLGVEEQYYILWPLLLIAVAALFWARLRLAVFVLATVGVIASATATIVLTTDTTLNRIYFGTDTRAQALLVGAAAAALLVRDWSVLNDGGTLHPDAVGPHRRAHPAVHRAGSAGRGGALRDGQCQRFPPRPPDRGGSRGRARRRIRRARAGRARRTRPGMAAPGVARGDLLRRIPLALADLLGAQRRTHGVVGLAAVRAALRGDGGAGRGVVVAAGTADPTLASRDRPDAAPGRCNGRDRGRADDDGVAGGRETRGGAGSGRSIPPR